MDFCRRLLATQDGDIQSTLRAVLESSEDLETLVLIVRAIGIENLPNSKEITELTAIAYFYPPLRSSLCQGYLDQDSSIQEVETSIQQLYSLYRSVLEEHPEDGMYGATDTARDIRAMATESLSVLDTRKALLDQRIAELQEQSANGALDEAVTKDLLLNFYNTHLKIAELQLSFGVSISYGVTTPLDFYVDPEATSVPDWTLEELQSLEASLNAIPEGHLLFSPLLFEIQKVKYLDPGVLAARYYDGVIKVVQSAGKSDELAKHYPTVDALSFVLTHEIGHGIQIGDGNLDYENLDPNTIDDGEQRYSFDDYVELSHWEVISPERWQLIEPWSRYDSYKVTLDGQLYLIGEPIEHNGRKIILQLRGDDILLACSSESEFASRWYAKVSPWEDFAEAFAEYIHCPERLIECAPHKFLFIEEEFRKYQNDRALLDLAEKRVKESSTHK
jgi:hypothetical protein